MCHAIIRLKFHFIYSNLFNYRQQCVSVSFFVAETEVGIKAKKKFTRRTPYDFDENLSENVVILGNERRAHNATL